MKNKNKIWLFIAIIAIIGFAAVSCDDGSGDPDPTITTGSLPNGTVGTAYTATLAATGTTPITWSRDSGTLPAGLTLSGNTIAGTPTAAGTSSFTVKATNSVGSATKPLSIVIAAGSTGPAQPQPGLYAKAPPITAADTPIASVKANDLTASLTYINGQAKGDFTLLIDQDINASTTSRSISNNLTIIGIGAERTISHVSTGSGSASVMIYFSDTASPTLTIGNNISIKGTTATTTSHLISVNKGGTIIIEEGSKIYGHNGGTPIYVSGAGASFIMNGGEISGNTRTSMTSNTAAVFIGGSTSFTMTGGKIIGNTVGPAEDKRFADVFIYDTVTAASINVSGAAKIDAITLDSASNIPALTIGSGFTGSVGINLQRSGTTALETVKSNWNGKSVVISAEGNTLTESDLTKFTLGNFLGSSSSAVNEPISNSHKLSFEDGAIKLVAK